MLPLPVCRRSLETHVDISACCSGRQPWSMDRAPSVRDAARVITRPRRLRRAGGRDRGAIARRSWAAVAPSLPAHASSIRDAWSAASRHRLGHENLGLDDWDACRRGDDRVVRHVGRHAARPLDRRAVLRRHSHGVDSHRAQPSPPDCSVGRRPGHPHRGFPGCPSRRAVRSRRPSHSPTGADHRLPLLGSRVRGQVPDHRPVVAGAPRPGLGAGPASGSAREWPTASRWESVRLPTQ